MIEFAWRKTRWRSIETERIWHNFKVTTRFGQAPIDIDAHMDLFHNPSAIIAGTTQREQSQTMTPTQMEAEVKAWRRYNQKNHFTETWPK